MRSVVAVASILALGLLSTNANAQGRGNRRDPPQPDPTVETWLRANLSSVTETCFNDSVRRRWIQGPNLVPQDLAGAIGDDYGRPYHQLGSGRSSLSDVFSTVWARADRPESDWSGYVPASAQRLDLRLVTGDDRRAFPENNRGSYAHSCSSLVSLAAAAGARVPSRDIRAALAASYNREESGGVSVIVGEFRSPVVASLFRLPGNHFAVPDSDRVLANIALWQWYRNLPPQESPQTETSYYILRSFSGVAAYRFTGLTWRTTGEASGRGGFNIGVASSSIEGRAGIQASGSAATTTFSVIGYQNQYPDFIPLPSAAAVAQTIARTVRHSVDGDWSNQPIENTGVIPIAFTVQGLPQSACTDNWTFGGDHLSAMETTYVPEAGAGFCRFSANFTPPAAETETTGQVTTTFTARLNFASVDDELRDINLRFPVSIPDARARATLLPTGLTDLTYRVGPTHALVSGTVIYQVSARGQQLSGVDPYANMILTCAGAGQSLAFTGQVALGGANGFSQLTLTIPAPPGVPFTGTAEGTLSCAIQGVVRGRIGQQTVNMAIPNVPLQVRASVQPDGSAPAQPGS